MSYEAGFAQGERDAYADRQMALIRPAPDLSTPYGRGYWDAYRPRSATWAVTTRTPIRPENAA